MKRLAEDVGPLIQDDDEGEGSWTHPSAVERPTEHPAPQSLAQGRDVLGNESLGTRSVGVHTRHPKDVHECYLQPLENKLRGESNTKSHVVASACQTCV